MELTSSIPVIQNLVYIFSSILFILGIKMLGKESTAVKGNFLSAIAMLLAVLVTTLSLEINLLTIVVAILIGASVGSLIALKVKMTAIPEMVALFNGFGGLASFFIAWSQYSEPNINLFQTVIVMLTVYIGGLTFSGSLIAYGKLAEKIKLGKGALLTNVFISAFYLSLLMLVFVLIDPIFFNFLDNQPTLFYVFLSFTILAGLGFVLPIGGGDMPVVISLLNSLSGIAAAFAGLLLLNNVLIVAGSLVGASGLILTVIMAKAMNRTIGNILFVGYASSSSASGKDQGEVKPINTKMPFLYLKMLPQF